MTTKRRRYISTSGGYGLTGPRPENGGYHELWKLGKHGYMAGLVVDDENLEMAIEAAKEEARVLMTEAKAEFGGN